MAFSQAKAFQTDCTCRQKYSAENQKRWVAKMQFFPCSVRVCSWCVRLRTINAIQQEKAVMCDKTCDLFLLSILLTSGRLWYSIHSTVQQRSLDALLLNSRVLRTVYCTVLYNAMYCAHCKVRQDDFATVKTIILHPVRVTAASFPGDLTPYCNFHSSGIW